MNFKQIQLLRVFSQWRAMIWNKSWKKKCVKTTNLLYLFTEKTIIFQLVNSKTCIIEKNYYFTISWFEGI